MGDFLMTSYQHLPVAFTHGEGACLYDTQGQKYLDALSGIAVCGLGHAHPQLQQAIAEQAGRLLHTSNLYHVPLQEELAKQLSGLSRMDRVFFCNSGAEANEAAIKIARLHGHGKGIACPQIIAAHGSFHGRTMATLSATGNSRIQAGFEPLLDGFMHIAYNDIAALEDAVSNNPDVVAIMLEPVQGEGGINIPEQGYLAAVRKICDQHELLFMLDEIQSGMGRTGKWFAFQHEGIIPDVMTLAKALGNGVPIGACLASGDAAGLIKPGSHGSAFGGNPLAARAGLTVINIMREQDLNKRARYLGEMMLQQLQSGLQDIAGVTAIRGKGLMIGIEIDRDCGELVKTALREGLLINVTAGNVVRLLPPLVITDEQAELIVQSVCRLVRNFLDQA